MKIKFYILAILSVAIVFLNISSVYSQYAQVPQQQEPDIEDSILFIGQEESVSEEIEKLTDKQIKLVSEIINDIDVLGENLQEALILNKKYDDILLKQLNVWKQASYTNRTYRPLYDREKKVSELLLVFKYHETKYISEIKAIIERLTIQDHNNDIEIYDSNIKAYLYDRLANNYMKLVALYEYKIKNLFPTIGYYHQLQTSDFKKYNVSKDFQESIFGLLKEEAKTGNQILKDSKSLNNSVRAIVSQTEELIDLKSDLIGATIEYLKNQIKDYIIVNPDYQFNDQLGYNTIEVLKDYINALEEIQKKYKSGIKTSINVSPCVLARPFKTEKSLIASNSTFGLTEYIISMDPNYPVYINYSKNGKQKISTIPQMKGKTFTESIKQMGKDIDGFEEGMKDALVDGVNRISNGIIRDKPMTPEQRKAIEEGYTVKTMHFIAVSGSEIITEIPKSTACILDENKSNFEKGVCTGELLLKVAPMAGKILNAAGDGMHKVSKISTKKLNKLEDTAEHYKKYPPKKPKVSNTGKKPKTKRKPRQKRGKKSKSGAQKQKINDKKILEEKKKIADKQVDYHIDAVDKIKDAFVDPHKLNLKNLKGEVLEDIVGKSLVEGDKGAKIINQRKPYNPPGVRTQIDPGVMQGLPKVPINSQSQPSTQPNHNMPVIPYQPAPQPPPQNVYIPPPYQNQIQFPTGTPQQPQVPHMQPQYQQPPQQDMSKVFDNVMQSVKDNRTSTDANRGQQNAVPIGQGGSSTLTNNFDTGFGGGSINQHIQGLSNQTGGYGGNQNIMPGNSVGPTPVTNSTANFDGRYTGTFKGNYTQSMNTYGQSTSQSFGKMNASASGGQFNAGWSGNLDFAISGTNVSGTIHFNFGQLSNTTQQWQGTINRQTGEIKSSDGSIAGKVSGSRASGTIVTQSSGSGTGSTTWSATKQ